MDLSVHHHLPPPPLLLCKYLSCPLLGCDRGTNIAYAYRSTFSSSTSPPRFPFPLHPNQRIAPLPLPLHYLSLPFMVRQR